MALEEVRYLIVRCDGCDAAVDSIDGEHVQHFTGIQELIAFFGGIWEGRVYPPAAGVDAVILEGGAAYCSECKADEHLFIPGLLLAMSCRRCGRLDVEHRGTVELPPADVVGQGEFFPDALVRPPAEPDDVDYCAENCTKGWLYPDDNYPEPPDGSRIEFVFHSDVYAARRNVASSVEASWPAASSWSVYPRSIPHTWSCLRRTFGPALRQAIHLHPLSPSANRLDSTR